MYRNTLHLPYLKPSNKEKTKTSQINHDSTSHLQIDKTQMANK